MKFALSSLVIGAYILQSHTWDDKILKSMKLLLVYQAIYTCQNWPIIYLPIDNINKKYSTYIAAISCHCYWFKLIGVFHIWHVALWYPILFESFYELYTFCHIYLITFLPTSNINKKYPIYIVAISYHYYC